MHAPIKWTALNHSLDVYLTNSDRHLLPEDVMLVKSGTYLESWGSGCVPRSAVCEWQVLTAVPPGTLAVVTQVPKR